MSAGRSRAVWAVLGSLVLWLGVGEVEAQSAANGAIRGRVVSVEANAPLGSANVVLRVPGRSGVAASTATDGAGRFLLIGVREGTYTLDVSYIGYGTHSREVTVVAGETLDVGAVRLSVEAIALDAVTVETERPQATYAPDRDIYATDLLPAADGGVATELMSSIPELEVDFDGTVTLRGSSPEIYINGRPAPMDGEALSAFLEQFPADRIERIEVIPNPSARFSAEGAGGIVNIVLKEGVDLGANGSVFANADTRGATGVGGQGSLQRGRLMVTGSGSVRTSNQERTGYDLRQNLRHDPPTYLHQDNWSEQGRLSGNARMSAEFRLNERSLLRAQGSFSGFGSESDAAATTTHMDHLEEWTQRYERRTSTDSDRRSLDVMLGFSHAIVPERHTLDVQFEFDTGSNRSDREVTTDFELIDEDAILPADRLLDDNRTDNREHALRVDYVRPWSEDGQVELGYRGTFRTREDERRIHEFRDTADDPTEELAVRGFVHDQTFHSGYLTLARRFGAFGVQLGTRARWMDTQFEVPTGEVFETTGLDVFPTVNLTYEFETGRRLRLSYSRRSRRPSPWRLNPIDQSTDPLNRQVGNPDLEPQYTHSFGFDASASTSWGTLRVSPYYRRVTNDWTRIQTVDEDGVATTTWENLAAQERYGASLTASVRRPNGWGGFVSLSGRGERRDASNLATAISQRSFYWSVRGNVSGQVIGGLGVRANLSYTPARDVAQGRVGSRVDSSIGLRQRFMDGKMSVSLTARDPFDISRSTFESRDPTFVQLGRSEVSRQSVRLSASYTFGEAGGRGRGGPGGPRGRR